MRIVSDKVMNVVRHFFRRGFLLSATGVALAESGPIHLKNQRELFVDDHLIASTSGIEYRLGAPTQAGIALSFDQPWEGHYAGAYATIIYDGSVYRMYYRGSTKGMDDLGDDDWRPEITCYAESRDGIHWQKPSLRLHEVNGGFDNNVILPPSNPYIPSDNFCVLYDDRPEVPAHERFKGVGGQTHAKDIAVTKIPGGLYRYVSADGIHWKLYSTTPLFGDQVLGSLNVLSWIPAENCYAIYLRSWTGKRKESGENTGMRTIARAVSKDFVNWSEPRRMSFGATPAEHLYTNATRPYFRAPHILIAMPMRFVPERRILSEAELRRAGVHQISWQGVSDAVLMTSRGGYNYDRKFMESFVRPGPHEDSWAARSTMPALGIVPTGTAEMSFYVSRGYGTRQNRLERLTLRLDGFASLHAGYSVGHAVTKTVRLEGANLSVNLSTSAIGFLKVTVLGTDNRELPGFGEADAVDLAGDRIDHAVNWKSGKSIRDLAGQSVRMKFTLRDADLYAIAIQD
jgi:hypothetical protein